MKKLASFKQKIVAKIIIFRKIALPSISIKIPIKTVTMHAKKSSQIYRLNS